MRVRLSAAVLGAAAVALSCPSPAAAQSADGSMSGRVVDALGLPLQGVCVEVAGPDIATAETGIDGGWEVAGVPEGSYLVAFNSCAEPLPGHAMEFFEDAASFDTATPVEVLPGEETTGVDAELEPAAVVAGTLTDDDSGEALAGVCAVALEESGGQFALDVSAEDGSYAFENLRAGDYLLVFEDCSDPFTYRTELYDDVQVEELAEGAEPTLVTVEQGEERSGVDAGLAEGGAVTGTLTALHTGRPAPLVCVGLFPVGAAPGEPPLAVGLSGAGPGSFQDGPSAEALGDYVVPGVAPGDYRVEVNPAECGDTGYTVAQPPAVQTVEIVQGEVVTGVDAVLAPLPSIDAVCSGSAPSGRFSDVDASSVHALAISCVADLGIASGRSDGTFGPGATVRRDQMATFVAGALEATGLVLPTDAPDAFTDDEGNVHEPAIDQLAALGVVTGPGGGRYAPSATVSRAQLATFLVRAYEEATTYALRADRDRFTDDEGDVHEPSIDKAATAGLTAGRPDGGYAPGTAVTRDQMATFMARLVDRAVRDTSFERALADPSPEGSSEAAASAVLVRSGLSSTSVLLARQAAGVR